MFLRALKNKYHCDFKRQNLKYKKCFEFTIENDNRYDCFDLYRTIMFHVKHNISVYSYRNENYNEI